MKKSKRFFVVILALLMVLSGSVFSFVIADSTENRQKGDVNGDGEVTVMDVMSILNAVTNEKKLGNADISGDGKLTLIDVIRVLRLIVE